MVAWAAAALVKKVSRSLARKHACCFLRENCLLFSRTAKKRTSNNASFFQQKSQFTSFSQRLAGTCWRLQSDTHEQGISPPLHWIDPLFSRKASRHLCLLSLSSCRQTHSCCYPRIVLAWGAYLSKQRCCRCCRCCHCCCCWTSSLWNRYFQ